MSTQKMDGLALLPDEYGTVRLADGLGVVRSLEEDLPQAAAGMMRAPYSDGPDVLAVKRRLLRSLEAGEAQQWRGLMAAVLLMDAWKEETTVTVQRITPETSGLSRSILHAAGRDELVLVLMCRGERRVLVGLADGELGVIPAAQPERLEDVLPARVTWYREGVFADPTNELNQRDRRLLAARLKLLGGAEAVGAFAEALAQADAACEDAASLDEDWQVRMLAAVSLFREAGYEQRLTRREEAYYAVRTENPVLKALGLAESTRQERPEQVTWLWDDVPFARTCEQIGLEAVPGMDGKVLPEILTEHIRLFDNSQRYCREMTERVNRYLLSRGPRFLQAARDQMANWVVRARARMNDAPADLALTWPWADRSPAVQILLTEALGPQLAVGAACGLADRLTLMQGGSMEDTLLDQVCTVTVENETWVAVPPLSAGMAECVARYGWTGHGFMPDCIRLEAAEDGTVTASVLLVGTGNVRITRAYRVEEQERWQAQDVPQIALWPSVPLESGRWKQYYVSVRGRADLGLLDHGAWNIRKNEEGSRVFVTDAFPGCVSLHRGGLCLGALMYQAPIFHPEEKGEMLAALDVGASGVAMAVRVDGQMLPVEIPSLWRTLLRGEPRPMASEPLPVWPLGPVLPGNAAVTGTKPEPKPFLDGRVLSAESLDDAAERDKASYDLLWRTDDAGRRARRLMLREAMLLTVFHGVMHGAQSVRWRVALPSAVSETGRTLLLDEVRELTQETAWETGLPLSGFAAEGMPGRDAAALMLRESGLRTAFLMLDIGAGSVSAALWLRGVDHPVMAFSLGSGLAAMLISGLTERADQVRADFAGLSGLPVAELAVNLEKAATSMQAWERSRLLLDHMLGAHLPDTARWMNGKCAAGQMTAMQALLVLDLAALMTAVGMLLEKAYRSPILNDHLPVEIPLCLCGRGSLLLTSLDETLRYQLTRFLRLGMSPEHPVRSIRMTAAGTPRLEEVQGLCTPEPLPVIPEPDRAQPIAPTAVAVRYFLMQFGLAFPQAAMLLFPGMIGPGGMLSPAAEAMVEAAAARMTGSDEEQLIACLNALVRS